MNIRKTVGIDLGTTNSVIALLDSVDSAFLLGKDAAGNALVPSIVGWQPEHRRRLAGTAVARNRATFAQVVRSVKRHIGTTSTFRLGEQEHTPTELAAEILRQCRECLRNTLGDPRYRLDRAVITMPAYFHHAQIEETRRAGELAGFEVAELIHEPTAAALYYSWAERHGDASYLVYDLGGGTFDVSVVRRRLQDFEVLAVSGDPFLGGDDFDRLLAQHLLERLLEQHPRLASAPSEFLPALILLAEQIKIRLSQEAVVDLRQVPVTAADGTSVALTLSLARPQFQQLIRPKVQRTIDLCHEAIGRAREKAGLTLAAIDHVILVGGSSRLPLVRETIQAAFCNPDLPERVRFPTPLLHEPDLCVAYGAALRAATHGTRYLFPVLHQATSTVLSELELDPLFTEDQELELHWTSPVLVSSSEYSLTGVIRGPGSAEVSHGGSLRIVNFTSGQVEEVFVDPRGSFSASLSLIEATDHSLQLIVCDNRGLEVGRLAAAVRHQADPVTPLAPGMLPTQLITRPLAIEILDRRRQRVRQILAPIGATLPGKFCCTCRTIDQSGTIQIPLFEGARVIKEIHIDRLDPSLPVGTAVHVELSIDIKHAITVSVRVPDAQRSETVHLRRPTPLVPPTREEIDELMHVLDELLPTFSGGFRLRMKTRRDEILAELYEARHFGDDPRAIQRMMELRQLLNELAEERGQLLDPPWNHVSQLLDRCRQLLAGLTDLKPERRAEYLDHLRKQEHQAEAAFRERDQRRYHECWRDLERYSRVLADLSRAAQNPGTSPRSDGAQLIEEARLEADRFREYLTAVWKQVRAAGRQDLDARLGELAKETTGLSSRLRTNPAGCLRDIRRLSTEIHKVATALEEARPLRSDQEATRGLLEGML